VPPAKKPKGTPPNRAGTAAAQACDLAALGRAHYGRRAWAEAHRCFSLADRAEPLDAPDLERFAWSASLSGRDQDFFRLLERLHQLHLDRGDQARAARFAFWHGMRLHALGEAGKSAGWLGRAQRLTERHDCAERGYLLIPTLHRELARGDYGAAQAAAATAVDIADRFGDIDLRALVRSLLGCALVRQGQVEAGLAAFDEAMVAATTGELLPVVTGLVYCNVLAGCQEVYAMDRSREWTAAFGAWCDSQPDLVPFSSACLVYRAELMQFEGAWPEAIAEARRAERFAGLAHGEMAGDAFYQQAEIHRLRGDHAAAEAAYRSASQQGRDAQPGLALLRVAQGRADDAACAIRLTLGTTSQPLHRARLLPAFVEIMLAAGQLDDAKQGRDELEQLAGEFPTEVLGAMAAYAKGAVALAEGHAEAALAPLRRSLRVWQQVGAPYIAARQRVLLARACRLLGDEDTTRLELGLAREVFERLGATSDLAALVERKPRSGLDTPLTVREIEVLRLVASGKTNKAIAKLLFLSEKTVDRHVSNILHKANVGSRAAATAYAYERGLVGQAPTLTKGTQPGTSESH
jgi:DNA-binding CsgD family transcriptional regulator